MTAPKRAPKAKRDLGDNAKRRDGKVGYGRPPRAYQWKPGQSGNSKGRRKGSKNTDTIFREILDHKIEVRVGGLQRKITVREAIVTKIAEDALKGDPKAAAFVLSRYDRLQNSESSSEAVTQDDHDIINAYLQRLLKKEQKD